MTVQLYEPIHEPTQLVPDDWDLDVTIIEAGPEADRLIRLTDDGCGTTCESACSSSCP